MISTRMDCSFGGNAEGTQRQHTLLFMLVRLAAIAKCVSGRKVEGSRSVQHAVSVLQPDAHSANDFAESYKH